MIDPPKRTRTFDCVAFKHRAQARLYEASRGMPDDQRREHTRRIVEGGPLAEFWSKAKRQARTAPKAGAGTAI